MTNLLPVCIGDVWFALDVRQIREILGQTEWVPLPGAQSGVPGVLPWNGRAIAVLDVGSVTGATRGLVPGQQRGRAVVAEAGDDTVAILVDTARDIRGTDPEELEPAPETTQNFSSASILVEGLPVPVLDLERMIAGVRNDG